MSRQLLLPGHTIRCDVGYGLAAGDGERVAVTPVAVALAVGPAVGIPVVVNAVLTFLPPVSGMVALYQPSQTDFMVTLLVVFVPMVYDIFTVSMRRSACSTRLSESSPQKPRTGSRSRAGRP